MGLIFLFEVILVKCVLEFKKGFCGVGFRKVICIVFSKVYSIMC